ncbi:Hypothetical protein POVN_LOCUS49 [uncultured virus]|nr:Hypothetical protein POVN_LOCUS49 [uncultured virus]
MHITFDTPFKARIKAIKVHSHQNVAHPTVTLSRQDPQPCSVNWVDVWLPHNLTAGSSELYIIYSSGSGHSNRTSMHFTLRAWCLDLPLPRDSFLFIDRSMVTTVYLRNTYKGSIEGIQIQNDASGQMAPGHLIDATCAHCLAQSEECYVRFSIGNETPLGPSRLLLITSKGFVASMDDVHVTDVAIEDAE